MNRLLVAPWHGLVTGGAIHLANGDTKPITQPTNHNLLTYGPGDTHHIQVPGISPITAEEIAATPPGGQYWAGKALMTASSLYGAPVNWIYQALDGSKWAVSFTRVNIAAASTELRLYISRFGEFGRKEEVYVKEFVVPVGRITQQERQKVFANLGALTSCTMRVHAVSASGRNVILAWCAFNDIGSLGEKNVDTRPRPFTFMKLSMTGSGELIAVDIEPLYGLDDIIYESSFQVGGGYTALSFLDVREVDREPILDEQGNAFADRITYEYESEIKREPANSAGPGIFREALTAHNEQRWMVMVVFEGETPTPCYLNLSANASLAPMRFTATTETPLILVRYYRGDGYTEQEGKAVITGGGSSNSNAIVQWEGPGEAWTDYFEASSSASFNGTNTSVVINYDGEVSGGSDPGMFDQPEPEFVKLEGDRGTRMPRAAKWRFALYSNNLFGVSKMKTRVNINDDGQFLGGLTPVGFVSYQAPFTELDQRHYGSFNPITSQLVVGSSATVNWA